MHTGRPKSAQLQPRNTMHKLVSAECRRLAETADTTYRQTMCVERLYFCGDREADGCWSGLRLLPEQATEQQVVTAEPVPWSKTVEGLVEWFYLHLRSEPLAMLRDAP